MNLGGDADTVGAIFGQLGGAYYGAKSIPIEWRKKCGLSSLIELFADELLSLSSAISIPEIPIPETTDWSKVNVPVLHNRRMLQFSLTCKINYAVWSTSVSDAYQNVKIKGYDLLEEGNREIVRKLNPCPKQYKT